MMYITAIFGKANMDPLKAKRTRNGAGREYFLLVAVDMFSSNSLSDDCMLFIIIIFLQAHFFCRWNLRGNTF